MNGADRRELLAVLRETRVMLARPENDFAWSSCNNTAAALAELDGLIGRLQGGWLHRTEVEHFFAPTGPLQETAISSGWGDRFLELADRCDAALEALYGRPGNQEVR